MQQDLAQVRSRLAGRPVGPRVAGRREGRLESAITRPVVDPSSGQPIGTLRMDPSGVAAMVEQARLAQPAWASRPLEERVEVLHRVAEGLEARAGLVAAAEVLETGKTMMAARRAVATAVSGWRIDSSTMPVPGRQEDWHPVGVVASILPSNAAIFTAGIRAGAALVGGNALVVKPPVEAAIAVDLMVEIAGDSGLPEGLLISIPGDAGVGDGLLGAKPDFISFTGSRHVGLDVASRAAGRGIPARLELGGGTPVIVLSTADLDAVIAGLIPGAFSNQGQVCVAAKGIRVDRSLYDALLERLVDASEGLAIGPAYREETEFGPIHTRSRLQALAAACQQADVVTGGRILTGADLDGLGDGFYFPPTVCRGLPPEVETFGPVVYAAPYEELETVIGWANQAGTGLAAGVWGEPDQAEAVASRLNAGQIYVNRHFNPMPAVAPAEPWRVSGFGRCEPIDFLRRRRFFVG